MRQDGVSTDRAVRSSRKKSVTIAILITLVLVTLGGVYLYPSLTRWASADRSIERVRLRLGRVERGNLVRDVSVQGRVVAAEHPTLLTSAQGVVSLRVAAGDVVTQRMVLASIESPELRNSLAQEQSAHESFRSELDRMRIANQQADLQNQQAVSLLEVKLRAAERAMVRAKELFEAKLASSIDYEKALDEVEVAKLELAHARQKCELDKNTMEFELRTQELKVEKQVLVVEEVERKIEELAIVSPVDGLVSRVDVRDKDTVQPNQPLMSVVDLSEFEVEVLIPENYVDEIGIGTVVKVDTEGRSFPGQVKSLSPEVENSQVKAIVEFSEEAPKGLKQNQRLDSRVILDSHADVLKVTRGPFLENFGGRQAYRVEAGLARLVPITVGAISITEVEIESGLEAGDQIVLSDLTRFDGAERILLRD